MYPVYLAALARELSFSVRSVTVLVYTNLTVITDLLVKVAKF